METTTSRTETTGHTEGPWRVEAIGHALRVVEPSGVDVALVGDVREPCAYADARLIARAPSMASALERTASGLAEIESAIACIIERGADPETLTALDHVREAIVALAAGCEVR